MNIKESLKFMDLPLPFSKKHFDFNYEMLSIKFDPKNNTNNVEEALLMLEALNQAKECLLKHFGDCLAPDSESDEEYSEDENQLTDPYDQLTVNVLAAINNVTTNENKNENNEEIYIKDGDNWEKWTSKEKDV
ncbi:hypothetical protein Mgra_00009949 [Meloidogyne graminicola]|uniref:Uncharacterized protein n=1 Tax=Meloidogyne graminicola TaxID=189291 RepID=A0A8S9Z8S7_9BILA|nr:hypothetical protein Mgra_00009949 [Meloidogyne graminicola]